MAASTRFAVAAHLMTLLAVRRGVPQTSEALARSAATNPAVVRRLLGALSKAGLVTTHLGKGGGAELARGPKKITLADIYRAVETPGLIPLARTAPAVDCAAGRQIQPVLKEIGEQAEAAFLAALETKTLKQLAKEIAAADVAAKSAA
ncbi:Rrf2 family transcriptional regulator [Hyphococcus luteus]|uniref:Transcriptional regulator n=1 Tax=Hyphococcus luteus TaxID=2058213 RepID=A0A2S7K6D5_9PROT|nr:Rrf2 family transcriptional regulator [Marinicaulis flavus]PQA88057.1 transcriptional regulator [Marinicaulis flavus]